MSSYSDRQLPRDGVATNILGWPGTNYHSIRYEPLCGTLGTDKRYAAPFSLSHCASAMDAFSNDTARTLAFYDEAGVRLEGAIVGAGVDLCMCFSLANSATAAADICWWVDGAGMEQIVWNFNLDYIVAGVFRPGSAKSLPQCASIDVTALQANWSATAVQPTATGPVATLTNGALPSSTSSAPAKKSGPSNSISVSAIVGVVVSCIIIGFLLIAYNKRRKSTYIASKPIYKPPSRSPSPHAFVTHIPPPSPSPPKPMYAVATFTAVRRVG